MSNCFSSSMLAFCWKLPVKYFCANCSVEIQARPLRDYRDFPSITEVLDQNGSNCPKCGHEFTFDPLKPDMEILPLSVR